ncbi:MAG: transglycosylase family protein [Patescibacteria group bacterium]
MNKKKLSIRQGLKARGVHKHPFVVPVITLVVLSFLSMIASVVLNSQTIGAADTHIVQLSLDGEKQNVSTRAKNVEEFLTRVQVNLQDGDVVEPAQDTPIEDDNFRINIYRARPVTIFDGEKRILALSAATTPRSVAAQVGIEVFPEDKLKQNVSDDLLRDQVIGEKIVIERATLTNLNLYGTPVAVRTHAKTVGELLKEKNIILANGDTVQPEATTPVKLNLQVFVTRFGTQIITSEESIPMKTEIIEDTSLSFGTVAIRQKGSPGKKMVTYQLELQNGKEVTRHIIQEVRILEPVTQITARGAQGSFGQALALLRKCESGGNYAINTGNGFYGAYQFDQSTWQSNAPPPYNTQRPDQTPPDIQDIAATTLYKRRGWQPWPGCTSKFGLQDIYR